MSHNNHISQNEIFPLSRKNRTIQDHLKECQQCSELVNILRHARKISKNLKPEGEASHPSTLQLSETITQIYECSISPQEAANFIHHVESCSQCFYYVVMTVEEALSPIPDAVLAEIEAYSDISLAEKALQAAPAPTPSRLSKSLKTVQEKMKKSGEKKEGGALTIPQSVRPVRIPWTRKLEQLLVPQLAYALVLLIAVVGGTFGGFRYYQTTYRINKAESLLTENHRIYMANTSRPSGGYASKGIDVPMAGEESAEKSSYLTQAFSLAEQAVENGSKSPKARLLQAQVFIIQKEYHKADSVFNLIDDKYLDIVLNDLGVLKYNQEEWQQAKEFFEAAIQANPEFTEAYYNLALAQNKLGKKEVAISTLNKYLSLENDEGWKNAALSFLQKLQNEEE